MFRKINILYVNYSLNVGGIETLILELSKELNPQKFQPAIAIFEPNGRLQAEFENAKIPVYVINKRRGVDFGLPIKLAKLCKKINIDIIHTHNQSSWLYGGIAAKLARIPLVHTAHTIANYSNRHPKRWIILENILAKMTDRITTVASSNALFMIREEHIPERKIEVIHNGIRHQVYDCQIDVSSKKRELGINDTDFVIGNVARFFPNKDHETLVKAFKIIIQQLPSSKLLLAGDGPLKNNVMKTVEDLGLSSNVAFLGNRRDIPEFLKSLDVFALSSIKEGLPIAILEAMASGLPVVATNVDGNGEVVVSDKTGFLVPPRDPNALSKAIVAILKDKGIAKEMGERGKDRVRELFSFTEMIKKYENVYSSLGTA